MRAIRLTLAAALGGAALAGCGMSKGQADRILAEQARVAGEAVMFSVSSNLVDPQTVQWGAVWANSGRICGALNPKNSAGDYIGFRRFVGQKGGRVLVDGWAHEDDFAREWSTYCTHAHLLVREGEPAGPDIHPMTDEERAAEQAAFGTRPVKLPRGQGVQA